MKLLLEYNKETGIIKDANGVKVYGLIDQDLTGFEDNKECNIEAIIKLKNAGFSTEDIVELRRKEII